MGKPHPHFEMVHRDIDSLFKSNTLDIVNEMDFKSSSATEAIVKIEKLSKLVMGANVSIKDIFFAQAIKDNIPEGGRIAFINAMALLDKEMDNTRFIEFKAAFRQSFLTTPSSSTFENYEKVQGLW